MTTPASAPAPTPKYSRYEWNNIYNIDFVFAARRLPPGIIDTTIYHPSPPPDIENVMWRRDEYLKRLVWSRDCVAQVDRLTKPNGTVWIMGKPQDLMLIGNLFLELGWRVNNSIRCFKPYVSKNVETRHWDSKRFSDLLWLAKGNGWYWDVDYVRKHWGCAARSNWVVYGLREDEVGYSCHPEQLSDVFIEKIIRSTTPSDGAVLDPFIRNGTTAAVCERNFIRYIGFETDESTYRDALARISQVKFSMLGGN